MATIAKLFRRPEDVERAVAELKNAGYEPAVIAKGGEGDLDSMGLSEQTLNYYKNGLSIGGKIVKTEVDDSKSNEVNSLLINVGFNELTARPPQWATSPSFVQATRMTATNPMDAEMTGDFRTY